MLFRSPREVTGYVVYGWPGKRRQFGLAFLAEVGRLWSMMGLVSLVGLLSAYAGEGVLGFPLAPFVGCQWGRPKLRFLARIKSPSEQVAQLANLDGSPGGMAPKWLR